MDPDPQHFSFTYYFFVSSPTFEILHLMPERVGGDAVRKADDPVGEVMHGQPGDDLAQLHAGPA